MGVLRLAFLSSFVLELAASLSVALVAVQIGLRLLVGDIPLDAGLLVLLLAPDVYLPLRQLGAAHHAAEEGRAAVAAVLDVLDLPGAAPVGAPGAARGAARARGPVACTVADGPPAPGLARPGAGRAGRVHRPERGRQVDPAGRAARLRPARRRHGPGGGWTSPRPIWRRGARRSPGRRSGRRCWRAPSPTTSGSAPPDASDADVRPRWSWPPATSTPGRSSARTGPGLSAGERAAGRPGPRALRAERGAGLLLLDEPTAHLDGPTQQRVLAGLRRLGVGRCVLLVVHDPALAAAADRIVHLPSRGEIRRPVSRLDAVVVGLARAERACRCSGVTAPRTPRPAGTVRRVLALAAPDRARFALALALGVLAAVHVVALMASSAWLISAAALQPPLLFLSLAIVAVRAFALCRAVFRYLERLVAHDVAFRLLARIRARVLPAPGAARAGGAPGVPAGGPARPAGR